MIDFSSIINRIVFIVGWQVKAGQPMLSYSVAYDDDDDYV